MKKEEIIEYIDKIFEEKKQVLKFTQILKEIKERQKSKRSLMIVVTHEIYNILVQNPKYIFLGDNNWGYYKFFSSKDLEKIRQRVYFAVSDNQDYSDKYEFYEDEEEENSDSSK